MRQGYLISKRYHNSGIDETEYSKIVFERYEKLRHYKTLKKEKCYEKTIFEVLEISKATFYRWRKAYRLYGLSGLELESKRPNKVRSSSWDKEIERRILELRLEFPMWGKAKIRIKYIEKYNDKISESTVGRILSLLIEQNKIKPVAWISGKKLTRSRIFQGHAQRWKKDMKAKIPGHLIQIDHMTLSTPAGTIKQFNAICPTTKIIAQSIYKEANSRNAKLFLQDLLSQFPFPIISIQVDGGSEFMGEFEAACKKNNIPLYVLPPRSPKCNGNVERCNGTFKYEFYPLLPDKFHFNQLKDYLKNFTHFYNKSRPHRSLNLLTPLQFYESIK